MKKKPRGKPFARGEDKRRFGKGSKHSQESSLKMSVLQRERVADGSHHLWQGGIWHDPYPPEWTDLLKEAIRQRDNYICQECGVHQDELNHGQVKKLDIHHIDYDKDNCTLENLIALCRGCHMRTNINREDWIKHFRN